jgi:hypothetical protein
MIDLKQDVLEIIHPPTFRTLFNKLNSLQSYDIAHNDVIIQEWFSVFPPRNLRNLYHLHI